MAGLHVPLSTLGTGPRGQAPRLGVEMGRYSFLVRLFHPLRLISFSWRISSPLKNPRGVRCVPLDEVRSVRDQGAVAALAG